MLTDYVNMEQMKNAIGVSGPDERPQYLPNHTLQTKVKF